MTVIDADGHVTESAEQVVKYMDAPFRNRQLVFPIVPADGWDRRLLTKYHDTAGTADAWAPGARQGRHGAGGALPDARPLHELPQGPRLGGAVLPGVQHAHARGVRQGEPAAPGGGPPADPRPAGRGARAQARGARARAPRR